MTPDPAITAAEFTYREARLAARWLRRQAEAAGVRDADLQRERLRARARIAGQKRDASGRWIK